MQIVLLGKIIKAMYKLSGKTLTQIADETDLTVDSINNLFYARLQKPSFLGVKSLVEATGYTVEDLVGFMKTAENLAEDADITEEFTKYIFSIREVKPVVKSTDSCARVQNGEADENSCCMQLRTLNEEHEKQIEHLRSAQLQYINDLHERYNEQSAHMEAETQRLKEHYDHSVGEIKKSHAREIEEYQKELEHVRSVNRFLTIMLIVFAVIAGVIAYVLK